MLETARTDARAGSLQECSSIGRAPVSKTGGRRFEPCHSCQLNQILKLIFDGGLWTLLRNFRAINSRGIARVIRCEIHANDRSFGRPSLLAGGRVGFVHARRTSVGVGQFFNALRP